VINVLALRLAWPGKVIRAARAPMCCRPGLLDSAGFGSHYPGTSGWRGAVWVKNSAARTRPCARAAALYAPRTQLHPSAFDDLSERFEEFALHARSPQAAWFVQVWRRSRRSSLDAGLEVDDNHTTWPMHGDSQHPRGANMAVLPVIIPILKSSSPARPTRTDYEL